MKALKEFALAASLLCAFAVIGCRNTGTHTDTGLGFDDTISGNGVITDDLLGYNDTPLPTGRFDELPPAAGPADVAPVYFAFGKPDVPAMEMSKVDLVAQFLTANPDIVIVIEGHCDERGTNEFNLSLGEYRAQSVRDALMARGVSTSRMQTISYGEERPADPGHNESAWAANRRAEFSFYQNR